MHPKVEKLEENKSFDKNLNTGLISQKEVGKARHHLIENIISYLF
jgi:hypothetical protein